MAPRRFTLVMLGAFGLLAGGLAIIGLCSVLAYLVTERTREIALANLHASHIRALAAGERYPQIAWQVQRSLGRVDRVVWAVALHRQDTPCLRAVRRGVGEQTVAVEIGHVPNPHAALHVGFVGSPLSVPMFFSSAKALA